MKIAICLLTAATFLVAVPSAEARKPFPLLRKLVKAGTLEKADLDGVKDLRKDFKACRKEVKAGTKPKGSCVAKRIEQVKAQIALFEKAMPKVTNKRHAKKAKRALRKLQKRLGRLEAKAGAGAPAAPAPAPAPDAPK